MPPSQVAKLIQDLQAQGQLEVNDDVVTLSEKMTSEAAPHDTAPVTNIGELLRLFTGSSRLSRAVGMSDKAIDFQYVSQTPLKIEAIVHGSQEYDLTLDEANRSISHNCPDWRRVSVLRRFCKHVAKLFLLLEKDQAIRVLQLLQQESWKFDQS